MPEALLTAHINSVAQEPDIEQSLAMLGQLRTHIMDSIDEDVSMSGVEFHLHIDSMLARSYQSESVRFPDQLREVLDLVIDLMMGEESRIRRTIWPARIACWAASSSASRTIASDSGSTSPARSSRAPSQ